jgi:hypothetical protein
MNGFRLVLGVCALATVRVLGRDAEGPVHGSGDQTWTQLGQQRVNFRNAEATIGGLFLRGSQHRIRLRAEERDVRIGTVTITFGNGETQQVQCDVVIPAGGDGPTIELDGDERNLRNVVFTYSCPNNGSGRALVKLLSQ